MKQKFIIFQPSLIDIEDALNDSILKNYKFMVYCGIVYFIVNEDEYYQTGLLEHNLI